MSALRRTVLGPGATLLLPAYLSACFRYVPASVPPLPKAGTEVRVTLAQPLDIPMGEFTLNEVTRIEGIVTDSDSDTLGLVAKWLYPRVGRKYDALMGSYGIPVSGIQQLEVWKASGRRTGIFLGVIAATAVLVVDIGGRALGGGGILPIGGDNQSVVGPRW